MYRMTLALALLFVLPAFLSEPAQAQVSEIIDDFCDDTLQIIDELDDEVNEARRDLEECAPELDDCLNGLFARDAKECVRSYSRCMMAGLRDLGQACDEFVREFKDSLGDALRRARRRGVVDDFLTDSEAQQCIDEAQFFGEVCAGIVQPVE